MGNEILQENKLCVATNPGPIDSNRIKNTIGGGIISSAAAVLSMISAPVEAVPVPDKDGTLTYQDNPFTNVNNSQAPFFNLKMLQGVSLPDYISVLPQQALDLCGMFRTSAGTLPFNATQIAQAKIPYSPSPIAPDVMIDAAELQVSWSALKDNSTACLVGLINAANIRQNEDQLDGAVIAGYVVAAVVGLAILGFLAHKCCCSHGAYLRIN